MREISASAKMLFADAKVSHLHLPPAVLVSPKTPLSQAIDLMKKGESGCILICDGKRLRGLFTERDLLNRVMGQAVDAATPIERFMTPNPVTLSEDAFLVRVVDMMDEK